MSSSSPTEESVNLSQTEKLRQLLDQDDDPKDAFDPDSLLNVDFSPPIYEQTESSKSPTSSVSRPSSQLKYVVLENGNCGALNQDNVDHPYDEELYNTLVTINSNNAEFLYPYFIAYDVKHYQVKYLETFHIRTLIPLLHLGIMAEFEKKFETWKMTQKESLDLVEDSNWTYNARKSLEDILLGKISFSGKMKKSNLTIQESKTLLNVIKDHFQINCNNQMRTSDMERIANEIAILFPGEKPSTYFDRNLTRTVGKNGRDTFSSRPNGMLYHKWNNRTSKEEAKTKKLLKSGQSKQSEPLAINEIVDENIQVNIQKSLQKTKEKISSLDLSRDWAACRDIRLKFILENQNEPVEILKEWPSYTWPEGNLLVIFSYK